MKKQKKETNNLVGGKMLLDKDKEEKAITKEAADKQNALDKKRKQAKKNGKAEEKPKSYVNIMKNFIENGATDDEIMKAFTALYHHTGQDDPTFVARRVKIYKRIAQQK